ncbi:MAG: hypothetical protein FWD98_04805 [Defluviitaleaceae bacterium]|nr:hypothetical protein [Defluviitaleaceae bacterium]
MKPFRALFSKNIVILILIISAAYLTGLLWFERISSSRNFFYTIAEAMMPATALPAGFELVFAEPARIVTGFANMSYSVDYLTDGTAALESAFGVLRSAKRQARHTGTSALYWPEILAVESYILEYPLRVPYSLVAGAWGGGASAFGGIVTGFDAIVISPGQTGADGISIIFIDSAYGYAHRFRLDDEALRLSLRAEISAASTQAGAIMFSASGEAAPHIFAANVFIPTFSGGAYAYAPLRAVNPYADASGEISAAGLLPRVSAFFSPPAAITSTTNPDEFIFSDEHTVVRFSHSNILQYSNHRTGRHNQTLTPAQAYSVARAFIAADGMIGGRVYLGTFAEDAGTFTFGFNLAAFGFPVIMPYGYGLLAPIEVTVRGASVTGYRKWAAAFERANTTHTATLGLFGAYDAILDSRAGAYAPHASPYITGAKLAFYPGAYGAGEIPLVWKLRFGDTAYIVPTHIRTEETADTEEFTYAD